MRRSLFMQLTLALAVMVVLIGGFAAFNILLVKDVESETKIMVEGIEEINDVTVEMTLKAKDLRLHIVQVQQWLTDISATRAAKGFDDGFDEAENHAAAIKILVSDFRVYFSNAGDSASLAELDNLVTRFDAFYDFGRRMATTYIEGGADAGNPMMEKFDPFAAKLEESAESFVEKQMASLNNNLKQFVGEAYIIDARLLQIEKVAIVNVVLVLIGSVALWLCFRSMVLRPLNQITARIKDIAQGEGDLTKRVEHHSQDELGELSGWFNTFVERIHDVIVEVSGATGAVAGAASQIAASSEVMSKGMVEQDQQVTQISAAIEQMSASVVEVAKKSADAASNAGESGKVAQEGGKIVNETIEGMRAISDAVSAGAASVSELGNRGEQIGAIIEVINDIADQTNLLALNAAIEAARAGEHGRGFAVVADEVRKLADRTTKATEEIAGSIKAIQSETGQAVTKMNAGTEQVMVGVESATKAGQSIQQIVNSAGEVAGMIQSIAAAAEEQSAASEQVSRNVESILVVTRQSAEGAAQSASTAVNLSAKAEQLQALVGQFKTKSLGA